MSYKLEFLCLFYILYVQYIQFYIGFLLEFNAESSLGLAKSLLVFRLGQRVLARCGVLSQPLFIWIHLTHHAAINFPMPWAKGVWRQPR